MYMYMIVYVYVYVYVYVHIFIHISISSNYGNLEIWDSWLMKMKASTVWFNTIEQSEPARGNEMSRFNGFSIIKPFREHRHQPLVWVCMKDPQSYMGFKLWNTSCPVDTEVFGMLLGYQPLIYAIYQAPVHHRWLEATREWYWWRERYTKSEMVNPIWWTTPVISASPT